MDPRGLVVTKNAYLLLLTHIKQLLLVTLCNTTAGIGNTKVGRRRRRRRRRRLRRRRRRKDGQT